ncbi:ATP-binding protein [Streptomyces luteolus]|uniref:ATP-grasp domain-containing protein n=1 Tax=Streptomyces luteolus TaxID=3043615 RepID=A0ABT6T8V5_9ACTN|nr:hypothetical protein [Streptomyces sp. B-S-A12]MDI3423773.1 hypothetical protein [Streptomyces sp. B-S-A12]
MSILILHRNPLQPYPYDSWLADYEGDVVLLAARDKIELFGEQVPTGNLGYRRLELLDTFDDEELVLRRALELAAEYDVEHVIAFQEGDLQRAAWLREKLDLPGQLPDDVLPFRDKVLMKQRVRAAGIEVAPHTVPRNAADVGEFAARHGFPLVFKERDGFGSIGLRIVRDEAELARQVAEEFGPHRTPREDLLLEAYVPGRMCHVDGLVVDGRIAFAWPSQYQYDLSSFQSDSGARIDLTLDPEDPLTERLLALTERFLGALQGGTEHYAFHAEVFHTPDDRLVFCEVASRPGGARIRDVMLAVFGVNPAEYAARAAVGLPLPALEALTGGERLAPRRMAGQLLMMKRPGRVIGVPAPPADPWVEFCAVFVKPGDVMGEASISSDFLSAAVLSAPTREECERRLRALGDRFEAETVIDAG